MAVEEPKAEIAEEQGDDLLLLCPPAFDPDTFDDLPEWMQERVVTIADRRQVAEREYMEWLRIERRKLMIRGGIVALALSPAILGITLIGVLLLVAAGTLLGRLIVDRELSPPGGALVYGGGLILTTCFLKVIGAAVLTPQGGVTSAFANTFLFAWAIWTAIGACLGLSHDHRRSLRAGH